LSTSYLFVVISLPIANYINTTNTSRFESGDNQIMLFFLLSRHAFSKSTILFFGNIKINLL